MPTDFRQQIRKLLIQKGVSAAKASRAADLNQTTVFNFLNGKSEMTAKNLAKLIDALTKMETKGE